jgi:hypothetical protein
VFRTLTVSKQGAGSGTLTSSPSGIDCGQICTAQFAGGTSVRLTAVAASGSRFTGWSGDCSGAGGCSLTMSANHTVTARFAKVSRKCRVPRVVGLKLANAKRKLRGAHCVLGKVTRTFSSPKRKGKVLAQRPKAGKVLAAGSKVNLTVGRGPR